MQTVRIASTRRVESLWHLIKAMWLANSEGAIVSIAGHERRIARECQRRFVGFFAVYVWPSEGGLPRNEAMMEAMVNLARTTRLLWLMACDANVRTNRGSKKSNIGTGGMERLCCAFHTARPCAQVAF